jgi:hypothetical protein
VKRKERWILALINIAFVVSLVFVCGESLYAKKEEFNPYKYWEEILAELVEAYPSVVIVWEHGGLIVRQEGLTRGDVETCAAVTEGIDSFSVALPYNNSPGQADQAGFVNALKVLAETVLKAPEGERPEMVIELSYSLAGGCKTDLLTGRNLEGTFKRDPKTSQLEPPPLCREIYDYVVEPLNDAGIGFHTVLIDAYAGMPAEGELLPLPSVPSIPFIPSPLPAQPAISGDQPIVKKLLTYKQEVSISETEAQWLDEHYLGQGNRLMAIHATGTTWWDPSSWTMKPAAQAAYEALCGMKIKNKENLILCDETTHPELAKLDHRTIVSSSKGKAFIRAQTESLIAEQRTVSVNRSPTFGSKEKSERREIYASGGGGKYGDLLLMDPSWAHRGCFTVTDPDGDELEIFLGSAPMYGEAGVVYAGAEGKYTATVTYQLPLEEILAAHYGEGVIEDFFTIVAQDPEGEMDEATITLVIEVVNRGVSAGADAAVTDAGVPVIIDVLTNDTDQDGDPLFIESVGRAAYGTVEILGEEVEYTPLPGFCCGIDGFAYVVTDRCGSEATGVVAVLVVDSEAPVLTCPGDIDVETRDPLGKVVTFTVTAADNCDSDPDLACIPSSGSQFSIGTTLVVCVAADTCGNMEGCTFEVTVKLKNRPPVALNDYAFLEEGIQEDEVLIPVLENDSDPDGDVLTIVWVGRAFHGRAQIVGDQILYTTTTPLECWPGDTFDYTIDDGHGGQATATVKVKKPVVEDSARMENSSGSWLTSLLIAQWEALLSPHLGDRGFLGRQAVRPR